MKTKIILIVILFQISAFSKASDFTLNNIFASNMVLQQQAKVLIWGKAKKGIKVDIKTSWNNQSYFVKADKNGNWQAYVSTIEAGGPYEVNVSTKDTTVLLKNILLGEVWLCSGQSNMEMPLRSFMGQTVIGGNREIALASKYKNIRIFQAEQAKSESLVDTLTVWHTWAEVNSKTVSRFSAVGWFFGKFLSEALGNNIPIGLVEIVWGGTPAELWVSNKSMSKITEIASDSVLAKSSHYGPLKPSMLYNAMINPVIKFNIKGAIWYQGEANVKRQEYYEKLFGLLINDWRSSWGYDFPFYFVQIAPYHYYNKNSAFLREAQFNVMQNVKNTGMVSTLDIGGWGRIHPGHKKEVGERLAYWALAKDYGFEGVGYDAPHYDYLEVKDTLALVYFKGDIAEANEEQLNGCFEIAGKDSVFYPAKAKIREWKNFAEVWSDSVSKPIAVRYCFKTWCVGKLFGTNELPVSSFRTDNWENK